METIEYHTKDKLVWGAGPWQAEPDKRQWQDPATGMPCLIVRGPSGALCGYVGVTKDHPLHGKSYDDADVSVHGGLTFADSCDHGEESVGICHVPGPGEPDDVWWFGFDCAHSGDYCPDWRGQFHHRADIYRDLIYVIREVESLALQLKALA